MKRDQAKEAMMIPMKLLVHPITEELSHRINNCRLGALDLIAQTEISQSVAPVDVMKSSKLLLKTKYVFLYLLIVKDQSRVFSQLRILKSKSKVESIQ